MRIHTLFEGYFEGWFIIVATQSWVENVFLDHDFDLSLDLKLYFDHYYSS